MKPLTAIIVGAGHRALVYASYASHFPEELQIVRVADPSGLRREQVAAKFGLDPSQCFESAEELATQPQQADFVINGTMDHQHVPTAVPLLAVGYDMLLEKPFATNREELLQLVSTTSRFGNKLAICHVLRYAPFYAAIRQRVIDGAIGEVINVQAVEHVSYHHMAVAFVRGKWAKRSYSQSSMLMAKCCHDLDLIAWMKSGIAPVKVASFGSNFYFRLEKAPEGAGTRCLVDCPIEVDCLYSAGKHYIDHPDRWAFYVWDTLEHIPHPTIEDKIASLKGENLYGRCVWKCDPEVVDHQSVLVDFADGATATLNMIGGAAKPSRSLHLVGTEGEIQGNLEDSRFAVRHMDPRPGQETSEQVVDLTISGDMTGAFGGHGGGDLRLVSDFLALLRGQERSISSTLLEDSIAGHLMGFAADQALEAGCCVDINLKK